MSLNPINLKFNKIRKLPIILQDERAECGHACIAMISNYLGHHLDIYALRTMSNPSTRGISLLEISQLFERLGFRTRALSVSLDELRLLKKPAILHWDLNHFVVLKQVKKNRVVIHDPAIGVRKCSQEEVSKSFTGIALEIETSSNFKPITTHNNLRLYDLVKTVKGINKFTLLLLLLSCAIEIVSLANPLFMQYVTDNVLGFSDKNNLYMIAEAFIIVLFVQVFTEYIRGNMVIYLTNNLTEQFASNVVNHLLKLPLDFFEKRHKGDIQSKFQGIEQIQKKISTDFINTVLDGFMIIINFAVMVIYSQLLTALVVFSLSFYVFFRYASYHFLRQQTESLIVQHAKATSVFLETLQSIIPIKSFLKEQVRFNMWRNAYINALNADIKVARINVIYHTANQLLFHLEHIVVVCVGASLVLVNQFSVGMLIAFLAYRFLLVNKASSFIQNIFDYKLIAIHLSRLSDILWQQPENPETIASDLRQRQDDEIKGALSLHAIFFKYSPMDKMILNNINLHISAGEKIAIVGPSGCGKSTLLKVMMGLLKMTSGDIYIDNISLRDFGLKNYRNVTAAVMQEDTLLAGSIIDNIAFFDEIIDFERVCSVAKLAYIHETIRQLPMGYETLIGEMGSTLSGGQKQRLLLARALYKKPKILFLDEATSHLDGENERIINNALKSLQMTQIIIAHRKETIQMADRVIRLEEISGKQNDFIVIT